MGMVCERATMNERATMDERTANEDDGQTKAIKSQLANSQTRDTRLLPSMVRYLYLGPTSIYVCTCKHCKH